MIRVLLMIAVAGFVLSLATLSAAFAIAGPDIMAQRSWRMAAGDWGGRWDWDDRWDGAHHRAHGRHDGGDWGAASGPQTTRTLAWSGAQRLDVDLPADVRYVQRDGAASVVVTGPQRAVERVIVRGDSIRYSGGRSWGHPRLSVVLTAPGVSSFDISGRNTLAIEGYRQPKMNLDVSGAAEVSAQGEVEELTVDLSGAGDLDLSALRASRASIDVSGSGDATVAPTDEARIDISGMGDVRLLTAPPRLETDISGAGRLRQDAPSQTPQVPSPPQKPGTPKA